MKYLSSEIENLLKTNMFKLGVILRSCGSVDITCRSKF